MSVFETLSTDVLERLEDSERDLEDAVDLRNRTCLLQTRTQNQLLQLESKPEIKERREGRGGKLGQWEGQ